MDSNKSVYESTEYKHLLNRLKAVEIERNEIEAINKKLLNDLKVYYEERIRILEMNNSSKSSWSNFENEMTKNYIDKSTECNLLSELNLNDLISATNSTKLLKNLNKSLKNELKKIKTELIEINIKRNDLLNVIENFNSYLINEASSNRKSKNLINRFKSVETSSTNKIKNEHLSALYEKFDQQIVELSNLFLNEKIDLIFKHEQLIDELNQKLIDSKTLQSLVDRETQTDKQNQTTSRFFKELEKIDKVSRHVHQVIQTVPVELKECFVQTDEQIIEIDDLNMNELVCMLNNSDLSPTETISKRIIELINQNKCLNQMNDELKLIIAQMYEKVYELENQNLYF